MLHQIIIEDEAELYEISNFHEPREGKEPGPKPASLQKVEEKMEELQKKNFK